MVDDAVGSAGWVWVHLVKIVKKVKMICAAGCSIAWVSKVEIVKTLCSIGWVSKGVGTPDENCENCIHCWLESCLGNLIENCEYGEKVNTVKMVCVYAVLIKRLWLITDQLQFFSSRFCTRINFSFFS